MSASIALDASLWDEPTTGIGLYTRQLHAALEDSGLSVARWGARRTGERPRHGRSSTLFTLLEVPRLLAEDQPPIFHAVSNFNLPLLKPSGVRFVLTVHDLIPLLMPHAVSAAFRWQFRLWLGRSLLVADAVLCDSDTTRRALLEHFEVDAQKVRTVHLGADHVDQVPAPDETGHKWLDALGLPANFVLYAGALDARKNVELVLRACAHLKHRGHHPTLVLAGQRWFGSGAIERDIQRLATAGLDVRPLGYLQAPIFYALMRRASVFVFPSLYEGFGLPPLEAMQLGVPTIVSTAGSLPEVCGDGALTVAPDDVEGLAHHLERLLALPEERQALAARGRARAARFTWDRTAHETMQAYWGASVSADGVCSPP